MEIGWHVMILLSISTLFIPIRLHLLQYITLGSRIQYKWTKAVISQVFSRQQLCDLISVLWLDQCHMCWHLAWRLSTWGTRVEVGAWRVSTLETMEMTAINNSRSPHLWLLSSSQTPMAAIPTLTSSPVPQTGDCGSPGRPTTHQSWFFHKWTPKNERQRHNYNYEFTTIPVTPKVKISGCCPSSTSEKPAMGTYWNWEQEWMWGLVELLQKWSPSSSILLPGPAQQEPTL